MKGVIVFRENDSNFKHDKRQHLEMGLRTL